MIRIGLILLLSANTLFAQQWQIEHEISFRIDVRRPGVAATGSDGSLYVADNHDGSIHRIDAETGDVIRITSDSWQAITDLAVLPSGDLLILDGHHQRSIRIHTSGKLVASNAWTLPKKEFPAKIVTSGAWGETVIVRQSRMGRPRYMACHVRALEATGEIVFDKGPFKDGRLISIKLSASRDSLGMHPWGAHDLFAGRTGDNRYYRFDVESGEIFACSLHGNEQMIFDTQLRRHSPSSFQIDQLRMDLPNSTQDIDTSSMMPASTYFTMDGLGQLWVSTGNLTVSRGRIKEEILLFLTSGKALGRLELGVKPSAFFMDRFFTLKVDSRRRQTVIRRYRLIPPR
ncbi:hypothetical protein KAR48_20030 [bacterium]|nr:hypothetical protein [bacterium]